MSEELNYAGKQVPTGHTDRSVLPWTITLLALTALAVFTCARIEILNAELGGYLPRDFHYDLGAWREYPFPSDPRQMNWNALLNTVETPGLMQYPLVFALLFGLPMVFQFHRNRRARIAVAVAFGLVVVCGALMIYRGYFSSLGW
jgi:hypothetical protein